MAPSDFEFVAERCAGGFEFLDLPGGSGQGLLFQSLGLVCGVLKLFPQDADRGVQLHPFVMSGDVEALDLLAMVFARILNRVVERSRGVAQLSDLVGRPRDGTLDSGTSLTPSFFKRVAQRRDCRFKLGDIAFIRCTNALSRGVAFCLSILKRLAQRRYRRRQMAFFTFLLTSDCVIGEDIERGHGKDPFSVTRP
jgi:hypothetical protein